MNLQWLHISTWVLQESWLLGAIISCCQQWEQLENEELLKREALRGMYVTSWMTGTQLYSVKVTRANKVWEVMQHPGNHPWICFGTVNKYPCTHKSISLLNPQHPGFIYNTRQIQVKALKWSWKRNNWDNGTGKLNSETIWVSCLNIWTNTKISAFGLNVK